MTFSTGMRIATARRFTLGLLAVLSGCSSTRGAEPSPVLVQPANETPNASAAPPSDAAYIATRFSLFGEGQKTTALHTTSYTGGQTTAATLESLKYFITSIQICEDVQTTGSGTGPSTGCLTIYQGPTNDAYSYTLLPGADWSPLAAAARASDDGFVDLMNPESRARLGANTKLQVQDIHAYNYGLIYWQLPIKVKASMPSAAGTTFFTHDGATVRTPMPNSDFVAYPTVTTSSLTTGPAEEAVILHPNGGTWIKFQHPLVVTQADIDQKQSYVLDLTFNPEGLVKGFTAGGPPASIQESGGQGNTISVPMLDLTPVPHRASETVVRETYLATVQEGADNFDVRLQLYSIAEDPTHTIYGVDVKTLLNAHSSTYFSDFGKIAFMTTSSTGSIDFQIYNHAPVLTGFVRGAAVGDTTTVQMDCHGANGPNRNGGFGVAFDACVGETKSVTFTMTGTETLAPATGGVALGDVDAGSDSGAP